MPSSISPSGEFSDQLVTSPKMFPANVSSCWSTQSTCPVAEPSEKRVAWIPKELMLLSPIPGPAYIKAVPPPLMVATTVTTFAAAAAGCDAIIAIAKEIAGTRCSSFRMSLLLAPWRTRVWPKPSESRLTVSLHPIEAAALSWRRYSSHASDRQATRYRRTRHGISHSGTDAHIPAQGCSESGTDDGPEFSSGPNRSGIESSCHCSSAQSSTGQAPSSTVLSWDIEMLAPDNTRATR